MEKIINLVIVLAFIYIVVSITVLLFVKPEEGFKQCVCSRGTEQNCQDTEVVGDLYRTGKLTEFSKLKRYEPSNTDYPAVRGCSTMKKDWDFTDFGN
jgi:hypothetical protein